MKTEQSRSDITSRYQPVARLDILYVSENKGFGNSPNTHFEQIRKCFQAGYARFLIFLRCPGGAKTGRQGLVSLSNVSLNKAVSA